ncbi:MAG TPA: GNAT family N-acetyltransferase [Frankiaceae bacterium]|nr:GNAT family N-acetyltransferase [Frankiaceae bacterium]
MLRAREAVRLLDDRDLDAALGIAARDPVANCYVASRLESVGADPRRLAAEVWGCYDDGELVSLCYAGGNLWPVEATRDAALQFADRARRAGRHCSSIVGKSDAVEVMWAALRSSWGPARDVRKQPLMAIDRQPTVEPLPGVRRVRIDELETLLPASVAMFTEEVGVSPVGSDGGALYRARVAELIAEGHAFALIEDGRVRFKAEVGSATTAACQLQGVWTEPGSRGLGIGTSGTAAVVNLALDSVAPVVSLYVNDYNVAARRAYERVGFTTVGSFTSVLF